MTTANAHAATLVDAPPRLGFIGTGWIGRLRMEALLATGLAECGAVYDPDPQAAAAAAKLAPGVSHASAFDELLQQDLDGVVIATPSAMHAEQCVAALSHGKAVFCQKPLARTVSETKEVVNAARAADRLLSVDFSYRHLAGMEKLREMIAGGELGDIFAVDLTFHNAYGPDKPWFYDYNLAGGGCVMDLGIHLVDLVLWLLDGKQVENVSSHLFQHGKLIEPPCPVVEDYAQASFQLGSTHVRLQCSWNLHAGQDAAIEARLQGTLGAVDVHNVGGSFFDFEVNHLQDTQSEQLAGYPDAWGGRALTAWVESLSRSVRYEPSVESALKVAEVIDRIYCR